MGTWAVGIVDSGVTDETEASYGANLYEYDFYYNNSDTDGGRATSHGSNVAIAVEMTDSALERIDLQVSNNSGTTYWSYATEDALERLATLHDAGWSIGAYTLSFGSTNYLTSSPYTSEISALAARGIFGVAASGNYGTADGFETAVYPAALANVISVGSHDGNGNPSAFSQNSPSSVHILADGQDFPGPGIDGTSFAAPQVAATVTTVQALVQGVTSDRLDFNEVIDLLQLGGAGPRSNPDPADGSTTYFLHTHQGSIDYTLAVHIDPVFSGLEYIASYSDLEAVFVRDAAAARSHWISSGVYEGRQVGFDALEYVASYSDLIGVFGTNRAAAASHYLDSGRGEGRTVGFDADEYMTANPDVAAAFSWNNDMATLHYITSGFYEGRSTGGGSGSSGDSPTVQQPISEGTTDLPTTTATPGYVGVGQSVTGSISPRYDRDWYRTELTAGETVILQARGSASGGGTLYDPDVRIRDANGGYITFDWDSGVGRDARLVYTPTSSGTHYIEVDGFSIYTGSYTLDVASLSGSTSAAVNQSAGDETALSSISGERSLDTLAMADFSSISSDPFGLM